MVELSTERLQAAAAAYRERDPFATVEQDRLETLPTAFANDSYLWKDLEWIVRWYCRRPRDGSNRDPESAFKQNRMSELETTIRAARSATTPADAISELLPLSGIDVPIASAFLYFMDPEQFVVMDEPSWQLLKAAGEIDSMWPDPVTSVDYANYLESCRLLATRTGVELHDIHRALWHCGQSDH